MLMKRISFVVKRIFDTAAALLNVKSIKMNFNLLRANLLGLAGLLPSVTVASK